MSALFQSLFLVLLLLLLLFSLRINGNLRSSRQEWTLVKYLCNNSIGAPWCNCDETQRQKVWNITKVAFLMWTMFLSTTLPWARGLNNRESLYKDKGYLHSCLQVFCMDYEPPCQMGCLKYMWKLISKLDMLSK